MSEVILDDAGTTTLPSDISKNVGPCKTPLNNYFFLLNYCNYSKDVSINNENYFRYSGC